MVRALSYGLVLLVCVSSVSAATYILEDRINRGGGSISWNDLTDIPAGFADNVDNTTGGSSPHTNLTEADVDAYADNNGYMLDTGDTATGDYTFDTDTFVIDSVNDRIGIGTSSPSFAVEIVTDDNVVLQRSSENSAAMSETFRKSRGSPGSETTISSSDSVASWTAEAYTTGWTTLGQFRMRAGVVSGSNVGGRFDVRLSNNTGTVNTLFNIDGQTQNVNIGTDSTPEARLEITGEGLGDEYLMVSTTNADDGDVFIIDENGDVGIGTTTPSYPLEVDGVVRATNLSLPGYISGSGILKSRLSDIIISNDLGGNGQFRLLPYLDDIYFENLYEGDIYFRTDTDTGGLSTVQMFIDGNNNRVGIGTTSPSQKLEVNGNIQLTAGDIIVDNTRRLKTFNSTGTAASIFFTNANNDIIFGDSDNVMRNFLLYQQGVPVFALTDSGIVVNDNGYAWNDFRIEGDTNANLFFVDASADSIGIGTSSPSNELTVNGDTNTTNDMWVGDDLYVADNIEISNQSFIFTRNELGNILTLIGHDTTNGPNKIRVGDIFNAADEIKFYVGGSPNYGMTSSQEFYIGPNVAPSTNSASLYVSTPSGYDGFITYMKSYNVPDAFVINASTGNVGIGTSTPTVALDVEGTIVSSDQYFSAYDSAGGTALGTSYTNITWDTEDREDDSFTHAADGSAITINTAGDYKVTAECTVDVTGTARYEATWHLLQNAAEVPGSVRNSYHRTTGNGADSMTITRLITASSSDTITLQGKMNAAGVGTTVADGCSIFIERV